MEVLNFETGGLFSSITVPLTARKERFMNY